MDERPARDERLVHDALQPCPYLADRVARLPLYRQLRPLAPDEVDASLARSERRVGQMLYRPTCPTCDECHGIRVLVDEFAPSRSQRRALRRAEGVLRVEVARPTWSDRHLELYNLHKAGRGLAKPDAEPIDAAGYVGWLVRSCVPTIEMRYLMGDRLVGVGIVDLGRRSASSVYFMYDPAPEVARLSPGVFSALQEVALCRRTGRSHLYLGLWVRDCPHMNYKDDYQPCEILVDGRWARHPRTRRSG